MDSFTKANKKNWDERAELHFNSKGYGVREFLAGKSTLRPIELKELKRVKGKKLLHLHCHFGLDTLSWARKGAIVTGVDFSATAISYANRLKKEAGLKAEFVCSDALMLSGKLKGKYDIVFASYGVLCWIADLPKWMKAACGYLRKGGVFYLIDDHPFRSFIDYNAKLPGETIRIASDYFPKGKPHKYESEYTYVWTERKLRNTLNYEWQHPLEEILNSLVDSGMRLEFIHEFPFNFFNLGGMKQVKNGWWESKNKKSFPMMLSVRAKKD